MSEITLPVNTDQGGCPFDALRGARSDGAEFWSARELQAATRYARWEDFAKIIERAISSARNSGHDVEQSFSVITEKPAGGGRPRQDFQLSRFAAYLTVMNGDPNMPEVAAAQAYFAIRTRQAEVAEAPVFEIPKTLPDALRLAADQAERAEVAEARVLQLDAKVIGDAPKVAYVDQYVADSDLLSLRTVAANNNVSEQWLRELLIKRGWVYMQTEDRWSNSKNCKETRRRYSAYAGKRNYFRPVETHEAPRFRGEVMHTLKVTPAGAEAISRLLTREAVPA